MVEAFKAPTSGIIWAGSGGFVGKWSGAPARIRTWDKLIKSVMVNLFMVFWFNGLCSRESVEYWWDYEIRCTSSIRTRSKDHPPERPCSSTTGCPDERSQAGDRVRVGVSEPLSSTTRQGSPTWWNAFHSAI